MGKKFMSLTNMHQTMSSWHFKKAFEVRWTIYKAVLN